MAHSLSTTCQHLTLIYTAVLLAALLDSLGMNSNYLFTKVLEYKKNTYNSDGISIRPSQNNSLTIISNLIKPLIIAVVGYYFFPNYDRIETN